MSDEDFQKLQNDVVSGNMEHFKEVEKSSEENENTKEVIQEEVKKEESKEPEDKTKEEKDTSKNSEEEPKVRKSSKDYIIERLQNKLKNKKETEDEDEINPNDKKLVEDVIDEKIGSKIEELEKIAIEKEEEKEFLQDMKEVDEFVAINEQFKPYRDKILKWWQHPTRKNLPLKAIVYEVAGDDLIALGAERERNAKNEADASATGSDSSTVTVEKKVSQMTDKEFEEYQNKVLYGK